MKLTLYDFLRIGHIKRWHNVNTIREQTVAEHSYIVMLIALDLFATIDGSRELMLEVLIGAMFHDAAEAAIGDTPTPAKRLLREISGDPELFTKAEEYLLPTAPYLKQEISAVVVPFIRMADAIEGAHWISENGAGKHAEVVKAASWRRLEDTVEKLQIEHPDEDWYGAVNRVLMAMGMRYVHRESRISPP